MPVPWEPESVLAGIVVEAGFKYDPEQDILYSRRDALQRKAGYTYLYDVVAPETTSANIHCEPIRFVFDARKWMIELWKGQYGIETGAEIGVYVAPKTKVPRKITEGFRYYFPKVANLKD